ncbi:protein-L-isoaspartate(D-aspartate) O-methyltransferase [Candidatus Woesearchaeota archaeon]|nr:protein-L-isoaspartate(D-aspartate) O-methyltransferase [Candidatus Woesearchaeota archaeon]
MISLEQKNELLKFWKENFGFREIELNAFRDIPREDFVHRELKSRAYDDTPLPLLRGKTISQPTTVMIMTSLLELQPGEKVFEVGTGSGYQAAIIARIVGSMGKVISTEIIPELVHFARENLKKSGMRNVFVLEDDGSNGMPNEAPFDKIIITSACREFPKPLLEQLKPDGIIVGPVGSQNEQEMVRGIRDKSGKLQLEFFGPFLFTPMYGKYGFEV